MLICLDSERARTDSVLNPSIVVSADSVAAEAARLSAIPVSGFKPLTESSNFKIQDLSRTYIQPLSFSKNLSIVLPPTYKFVDFGIHSYA